LKNHKVYLTILQKIEDRMKSIYKKFSLTVKTFLRGRFAQILAVKKQEKENLEVIPLYKILYN